MRGSIPSPEAMKLEDRIISDRKNVEDFKERNRQYLKNMPIIESPAVEFQSGNDWERAPMWPLPQSLADETMVWQRACFILQGIRPDGSSVTQIVDIGHWWGSEAYRQGVYDSLARTGFSAISHCDWIGVPMRSPGSEQRIAASIAYVQDHSQDEPPLAPNTR